MNGTFRTPCHRQSSKIEWGPNSADGGGVGRQNSRIGGRDTNWGQLPLDSAVGWGGVQTVRLRGGRQSVQQEGETQTMLLRRAAGSGQCSSYGVCQWEAVCQQAVRGGVWHYSKNDEDNTFRSPKGRFSATAAREEKANFQGIDLNTTRSEKKATR